MRTLAFASGPGPGGFGFAACGAGGGGAAPPAGYDTDWVSPSSVTPLTVAGDSPAGTINLSQGSVDNVLLSDDARTSVGKSAGNTNTVRCFYDLGALPDSGTISKISVRIEKFNSNGGYADLALYLITANAGATSDRLGPNKASAAAWPGSDGSGSTSEAYVVYEWTGADLAGITLAALNALAGTDYRFNRASGSGGIDHIQIRIEGMA
jgi:hypothetical protein